MEDMPPKKYPAGKRQFIDSTMLHRWRLISKPHVDQITATISSQNPAPSRISQQGDVLASTPPLPPQLPQGAPPMGPFPQPTLLANQQAKADLQRSLPARTASHNAITQVRERSQTADATVTADGSFPLPLKTKEVHEREPRIAYENENLAGQIWWETMYSQVTAGAPRSPSVATIEAPRSPEPPMVTRGKKRKRAAAESAPGTDPDQVARWQAAFALRDLSRAAYVEHRTQQLKQRGSENPTRGVHARSSEHASFLDVANTLLDFRYQNKPNLYKENGRLILRYTTSQLDIARKRAPIEQQRPDKDASMELRPQLEESEKDIVLKPLMRVDSIIDIPKTMA
jgi:hypothetical protein